MALKLLPIINESLIKMSSHFQKSAITRLNTEL